MAFIGFYMIALFATAFVLASLRRHDSTRWFLRLALYSIPLPWVAIELGWMLAEIGRQPWAIDGVLPTFLATSTLSSAALWTTIVGFTLLYGALAVIEVRLMIAAIRKGPFEHVDDPAPEFAPESAVVPPLPVAA